MKKLEEGHYKNIELLKRKGVTAELFEEFRVYVGIDYKDIILLSKGLYGKIYRFETACTPSKKEIWVSTNYFIKKRLIEIFSLD